MSNYKNMGNNQIMTELQSLKAEHEAVKQRMLKDLDLLNELEKKFNDANNILAERIKGQTNA